MGREYGDVLCVPGPDGLSKRNGYQIKRNGFIESNKFSFQKVSESANASRYGDLRENEVSDKKEADASPAEEVFSSESEEKSSEDWSDSNSANQSTNMSSEMDARHGCLDPNAREFTPLASPCRTPPSPLGSYGPFPPPYFIDSCAPFALEQPVPMFLAGSEFMNPPLPNQNIFAGFHDQMPFPPSPSAEKALIHGHNENQSPVVPHFYSGGSARICSSPCYGREHASRAILLMGICADLSADQIRCEMEHWGPVRGINFERHAQGYITVHYFDLRHAKDALRDIQHQHLLNQYRVQTQMNQLHIQQWKTAFPFDLSSKKGMVGGKAIWAQFVACLEVAGDHNQGTLVVFNVDPSLSLDSLRKVFENYGSVKELRETPTKRQHKFVEFFDIRDAGRALVALNGTEIGGKHVKIEFSRPGGQAKRARAQAQELQRQSVSYPADPAPGQPVFCGFNPDQCYPFVPMWVPPQIHHFQPIFSQHQFLNPVSKPDPNPKTDQTGFSRRRKSAEIRCLKSDESNCVKNFAARKSPAQKNDYSFVPSRDVQYVFDEFEALKNVKNPRTTLMIKNIPNKYSQQMLLNLLDNHCMHWNRQVMDLNEPPSAYDFVYLPIDFKNRCNLGYAFVNLTSVQATVRFYKEFHEYQWEAFNSRKICEVSYARVQGRAALEEHFRNSRFACDTDEFLPLVFSPPRTGIECPSPMVVGGHSTSRTAVRGVQNGVEDVEQDEAQAQALTHV